jgi:hypothetical protein
MKALSTGLIGLTAICLLLIVPFDDANADRRHGHQTRINVGVGFGHGFGYSSYRRPYGYYGSSFYRSPYYSGSHFGFGVWPRYRSRRIRQEETAEVRNDALYIYPAAGQTDSQMADDRYACHVWSVDSTEFDPTLGAGTRVQAGNYGRAFTACMEGRSYVVK